MGGFQLVKVDFRVYGIPRRVVQESKGEVDPGAGLPTLHFLSVYITGIFFGLSRKPTI